MKKKLLFGKKNKKNKSLLIIIGICFVLLVSVYAEFKGIGKNVNDMSISVPKGSGSYEIAEILKSHDVINSKTLFYIYSRVTKPDFKYGLHKLSKSGYGDIAEALTSDVVIQTCTVTIPEGLEMKEIAEKLASEGLLTVESFYENAKPEYYDYWFLKDLPKREEALEGYLFPDTYNFSGNETPREIINALLSNFDKKITQQMKDQSLKTGLSFDEIITLASIIEREAADHNEFKKVAGVFYNRINKKGESNGFLESCATVQYILKERKNVLSVSDTKIDSPYNTYKYPGLPAGPISSPGLKAIESAIYPEKTDYLYFVADGNGNHYFAKDYNTHLKNTKKAGL